MRSALQLRRSLAIAREEPVNVYDVAAAIGVEVRFLNRPSLEGMFSRVPHPTVFLPSLNHRPRGRVTFSCAHEIGHFQLGHGTKVDEYLEGDAETRPRSDEELSADTYASSLLMPRQAVLQRFLVRGMEPSAAPPQFLFMVAAELDVGYQTLLKHLCYRLELVSSDWLRDRQRTTPKQLRTAMLGSHESPRLVMVDQFWPKLPLDLEVDECIVAPAISAVQVPSLLSEISGQHADWRLFRANKPGMSKCLIGDNSVTIRVARSGYCGTLKFRFLNDPEAE